jgi:hypothetical protein
MQSRLIRCLIGALLTAITATTAPAQTAQQATPQTLQAMIGARTGGAIALAPGDYGSLSLRNLQAPASAPFVITSADPAHPARFSGLALKGVSHLTLQDVVFDYTFQPGDAAHLRPFAIADSQGITISRTALARRVTALAQLTACGLIAARTSRCKTARSLALCAAWW